MLSSLLNSTNSDPVHASSPGSARLSSPGKQNSVPWSPSASRSPVKQSEATLDAHPHGKNAAAAASSASPSTPSRAALGNLIHATDQEPRATPTPNGDHTSTPTTTTAANHNNKDDLSSSEANGTEHKGNSSNTLEDGDITMDDAPDEELVEEAMRNTADMSDEGEGEGEGDGEDDDDDDDDDDDEDDDDEDSEDDGDDSDSSVSTINRLTGRPSFLLPPMSQRADCIGDYCRRRTRWRGCGRLFRCHPCQVRAG